MTSLRDDPQGAFTYDWAARSVMTSLMRICLSLSVQSAWQEEAKKVYLQFFCLKILRESECEQ
jgi:hypothetical protein